MPEKPHINDKNKQQTGMLYRGRPAVIISAAGVYLLFIALTNFISAAIVGLASGDSVLMVLLILSVIFGIASMIVAFGVFLRASWAFQGAILINAINILLSVFSIVQDGQISLYTIIFIFISGLLMVLFLVRQDIKAAFKRA